MSIHSSYTPPRWIRNFLRVFLGPRLLEASLGDLEEKFCHNIDHGMPLWKAKFFYITEALGFLKMARRPESVSAQTTINMISHTLLFFTRLVQKDKGYYLVSVLGLTLSLSSFLFIMMFIGDELAYDRFHENRDRIFRVTTHLRLSDVNYDMATSQFPAAEALRSELEEIEQTVRIFPQSFVLQSGDKKFEERTILADENFFNVFTFPLLYGDVKTAMAEPASIILTRSSAIKYFGVENPIGMDITISDHTLVVTGVIGDVPEQSHLKFTAIIPLQLQLNIWKSETGLEGRENKWFWIGAYTYALLKEDVNVSDAQAKIPHLINKYFPERYKGGRFELQPLTNIHLNSTLSNEPEPGGNILYVKLFSIVAFVIMLVSAINLINLSWFKINSRVREVGIRKFLGQNAAKIIVQLSVESILIGILSFLITIGLCQISIGNFNLLVQKNLDLWSTPNIRIIAVTLIMIVAICVMAVIRPSFRYATKASSFLILQKYKSPQAARLRSMLIGLQVCFSFVLLVFSLIISSQIDFFRHKDLGFDRENIVVVELNEDLYPKIEAFKNELKKSKEILEVAGGAVPGKAYNGWRFVPEGGSYEKPYLFPLGWCDYNFLKTLNIKLLMGRDFDPPNAFREPGDSLWHFIINKRAAIELGWLDDPINKTMEVFAAGTTAIMAKGRVIGIMEDFHFESLHSPVKPVVLTVSDGFGTAVIKVSGTSPQQGIADITAAWKKFSGKPFEYEMLDQQLEKLYTNETKLSQVILFFTCIALYLTCYGLFAMSSLLFSSRLKEVAIRKVFGADQFHIIKQLYSRYALFNLIAIVLGLPIAMYVGNLWLQTFQYRIELNSSFFIKAAICILIAGLVSVSYYLTRVACSNPVKFLRNE